GGASVPVPLVDRTVFPLAEVHPGLPALAERGGQRGDDPGVPGVDRQPDHQPVDGPQTDEADVRDVLLLHQRLGKRRGVAGPYRSTPPKDRHHLAQIEPNTIAAKPGARGRSCDARDARLSMPRENAPHYVAPGP